MKSPGAAGDLPSDVRESLDALRRIVRELRLSAGAAEKKTGLSGAQLFVLQRLAEKPADTLGDLAERTFTHQSSVSVVVRKLAERGLIERSASDQDARRVTIELSRAGRALLKRAPRVAQERLISAIQGLPAGQRRELAKGLAAVVSAMGIDEQAASLFFEDGRSQRSRSGSTHVRSPRR
jgi:DNA-binding MarR family transcriptional regulator